MDWLFRGCILLSINAERNIVDQGMKLPILYDSLEIMTGYFHQKAETLLNDKSQRILTTNLLVKNQHGVQRQIQENLNTVDSL